MAKRRPSGEGLVRLRDDGRWEGRIVVGHKKNGSPIYKYVFAKTQKELMPKLHQLIVNYDGCEFSENSHMTLAEWLDKWLYEYKLNAIRETTIKSYKIMIELYIKPNLGHKLISKITIAEIQRMYNKLKAKGRVRKSKQYGNALSDSVVRSVHMLLHQAMESAVRENLIISNPTVGTTIPKTNYKEKTILLKSQIDTLMNLIQNDEIWHDFFYTEIMTGMRRGEICGLRWMDFDEINGRLHIRRSLHYEHGEPIIGETKTNQGNRVIILPGSVTELLKERHKSALSDWIFPDPMKPQYPVNPTSAYYKLKTLLEKGNLPNIRFHDLRHTFATHAASNGVDPKTLSSVLGHTKASFTLDTYTHVTTDMQKNASNIVENFITDIFGKELEPWQSEKEEQEV